MLHGQTGKISVLSVDISVLEQREHCWTEVPLLVVQSLGTLADEFIRFLWLEIVPGGYDDTVIDQEIARVGGCLIGSGAGKRPDARVGRSGECSGAL